MKNWAGVVGQKGLGPAINRLADEVPNLVHLIGHSFGARLVSYALAGLDNSDPSPISRSHFFGALLPLRVHRCTAVPGGRREVGRRSSVASMAH
jgi:hypothetical protein